jgi:transposase
VITSQGTATHITHLLGPHPIVAHFLQRLKLPEIVRSFVGSGRVRAIEHGEALAALVHNVLDSPAPLYRIAEWADPIEPTAFGFTPEQKRGLNDDRIARMLDAIVSERGRGIWFSLALEILREFKIARGRMHHDTTTVTFCGDYRGSVREPRITHGMNKDHRPDLKQLVFGLTVSADGAVPINHQVHNGNRSDDTVHRGNIEELRSLLGRSDFIYVADCKLASSSNLKEIAGHGGKFVTVLARTRNEDKRLRARLKAGPVRWKKVLEIPNKRSEAGPPDVFYSCAAPDRTAEGFRVVWFRSSAKAALDGASREKRLTQAQAELGLLSQRLNRRQLRSARQIRKAVREIVDRRSVVPLLRVRLKQQVQQQLKRLRRGRPGAHDPVRVLRRVAWSLDVRVDEKVLRAEERADGVFPLACNLDRKRYPKKEVLSIYKYQAYVEKRFSQLKTDLEVAPVYLKKPHRCAGLVHAYYVALAVSSLIERAVRQGMKRKGIEELPLFPERRPTKTPTCARILDAFRGVSWYEFRRGEEVVCFPLKLDALQRLLLELLEVPPTLYA